MSVTKGSDGYYHPRTEDEVRELILYAREHKKLVRVRGSAHSAAAAIYTTCEGGFPCDRHPPPDDGNLNVMLDQMYAILGWNDDGKQVTVQAGCHLGKDPSDPTHTSTVENSLFHQMDKKDWAIPDMGGITHQTVGGFLSTGSSGSSLHFSFNHQLVGLRLIDGTGKTHDLDRSDQRFYAAGVSLGLLGIITRATFKCRDTFNIRGEQSTTSLDRCKIDLFGNGSPDRPSLEQFFRKVEHTRLMWWPQKGANRMQVWQATMIDPSADFEPKPYREFPKVLGSRFIAQVIAAGVLRVFVYWITKGLLGSITRFLLRTVYPPIVRLFEPEDGKKGPQKFQDYWWRGLPMDNAANDELVPTRFTELWIDVSKCAEVMRAVREVYVKNGVWATGSYSCEIYPTPASEFWMSPAYKRDVVKVDIFWFGKNKGNPLEQFYPQFWDALKAFQFRPHWGKYLPYTLGRPTEWLDYVRRQYPKWDDFMRLRETMDPDQVFVTEYWRTHLGIAPHA